MLRLEVLPSLLAVAAFLPPCFYLWSVATFDRRHEPAAAVVGTFALGALGALLLNRLIAPVADAAFAGQEPVAAVALRTLFLVSAPEEATKFLILAAFARHFISRDNPMSGLVFGAAVGLGFAAVENVGYLLIHLDRWTSVAFVRSVVTVPVHGVLGIIAGVYVARARAAGTLSGGRGLSYRAGSYAAALLLPIAVHALYNLPFALTRASDVSPEQTITLLKAMGLAAGLAIAAAGMSITFRMAATQDPAFEPHCLSPYLLRAPWRAFVLGSLLAVLGLVIIASEIAAAAYGAGSGPRGWPMLALGAGLLVATGFLHRYGSRQRSRLRSSDT